MEDNIEQPFEKYDLLAQSIGELAQTPQRFSLWQNHLHQINKVIQTLENKIERLERDIDRMNIV